MANVNFHQVFKMFVKYLVLRIYKYLVVLSSGRDGVGLVSCVSIYKYCLPIITFLCYCFLCYVIVLREGWCWSPTTSDWSEWSVRNYGWSRMEQSNLWTEASMSIATSWRKNSPKTAFDDRLKLVYNFLLCSCENFYKIWVSSDWWLWFCTGDTGELSISWDQAVYGLRLCIVCDNLDVFSAVEAGPSSCACSRHIMAGKHWVYKL